MNVVCKEPSPLTNHQCKVNSICKCWVVSGCNQERDYVIIILKNYLSAIIIRFECGLFIASNCYIKKLSNVESIDFTSCTINN